MLGAIPLEWTPNPRILPYNVKAHSCSILFIALVALVGVHSNTACSDVGRDQNAYVYTAGAQTSVGIWPSPRSPSTLFPLAMFTIYSS